MVQSSQTTVAVQKLEGKLRLSLLFNAILILLVIFLSAVLIFRSTGTTGGSQEAEHAVEPAGSEELEHIRGLDDDPMAVGDPDAPVVISEWADYRCPYCAVFANETLPTLLEDYVDSGQVRIEFNDVYFFGDESFDAAVAARAAAAQGHYLPYMQVLYSAAPEKGGHPPMPRDVLIEFAREAGVPDLSQFENDLDSPEIQEAVQRSHDQAVNLGISSVPFFAVGDQGVSGAQPLEVFVELIEQGGPQKK